MKAKYLLVWLLCTLCMTTQAQQAEQMLGMKSQQQTKDWSQNVLAFSFNPGFITSKVDTGYDEKSWVGGMGFAADYRCVFRSGYGFGLAWSHSQTNYDLAGGYSTPVKLDYIGPSFVMASPMGQRWHCRLSWGLGYAHYSDGYESDNGFGYQFMGGVEYRLGKSIALGVDLTETIHTFSKQETNKKNEINGFSRLGMNMGLRVYL